jgi:PhzF family phenazine biosynthesis protein
MRTLPYAQVDAFADAPFSGNPAAVVRVGSRALPAVAMQSIAAEANLSETAFVEDDDKVGHYRLRWFTPTLEVDLCGHATLAAAHVVLADDSLDAATFHTRSGPLTVRRTADGLAMDLPRIPWSAVAQDDEVTAVLRAEPAELFSVRQTHGARYLLARFETAAAVRLLRPDTARMGEELGANIIVTAPAEQAGVDFVSRFFAPASGVPEDPVTGSAHCTLAPFWAERLGKRRLVAHQLSRRGGELICKVHGDGVTLVGHCADYLQGRITVPLG